MYKFIVYGLGISGISTAKALAQKNFEIIATDDNQVVIDQNIQTKIDASTTSTPEQKQGMQNAADAIIKIVGNTAVLINQIVPTNFESYWNILKPLMKPAFQIDSAETTDMKTKLFDLVVSKDNVGESMWYMYTGVLLTSLVQLKMTTRGCANNAETMEKNYQQFLAAEQESKQQKDLSTSTTYTITS